MKKILLLAMLFLPTSLFAVELKNFNEVKAAVLTGQSIKLILHYQKCSGGKIGAAGIINLDKIIVLEDRIVSSFTHFTRHASGFVDQPVLEYVYYQLLSNDTVKLQYQFLDASTKQALAPSKEIVCKMRGETNIYAH